MLNHLIQASGEQRRELIEIREELERVRHTLRERESVGTMAAMDAMRWREFEDHVAGLCRRDGCTDVTNTGTTSDLGADLTGRTADGRLQVLR